MAKKKVELSSKIRINAYNVLGDAMESSIGYGWNRAHKHDSDPGEDTIKHEIYEAVMLGLCEVLRFDDDY